MSLLDNIKDFHDLKDLSNKEIKILCKEIRNKIIDISKKQDIHLSSNLGIVELSTMILKVFNLDKDKLLYDTGHQTYVHKILTGRKDKIDTIRQPNGLCGLMNMNESKYDHYSPGHSGNVLSVISGMYTRDALKNKDSKKMKFNNDINYIAVIGDSSFANGLNFEALNDISFNHLPIIIILNDNEMSISKSVGALSNTFNKIKGTHLFHFVEKTCRKIFNYNSFYFGLFKSFNWCENRVRGANFFENLGYYYIGPVDGHNIKLLNKFLLRAKWFAKQGPVIIHVKTKKGKGYEQAENDLCGHFHSSSIQNQKTIGMHMTDALIKLMKKDSKIYVINPAMTYASNCQIIKQLFPNRYWDVGISEEHAISKASGMALVGLKPYLYFYSTFLQRGYDQLIHDISRLHLNCTLLIDRCDLSGADGSSHHGIYDVNMLKSINNVLICSGRNLEQDIQLLNLSHKYQDGIFAIRYPRLEIDCALEENYSVILGKWEWFEKHKSNTVIISYGPYLNKIINEIYLKDSINVINAIFITKYHQSEIKKVLQKYKNIIIYERIFEDGLANDFFKVANELKTNNKIIAMNYQQILENGSTDSLDKIAKMTIDDIKQKIKLIQK